MQQSHAPRTSRYAAWVARWVILAARSSTRQKSPIGRQSATFGGVGGGRTSRPPAARLRCSILSAADRRHPSSGIALSGAFGEAGKPKQKTALRVRFACFIFASRLRLTKAAVCRLEARPQTDFFTRKTRACSCGVPHQCPPATPSGSAALPYPKHRTHTHYAAKAVRPVMALSQGYGVNEKFCGSSH